jgi:hypothetical protein
MDQRECLTKSVGPTLRGTSERTLNLQTPGHLFLHYLKLKTKFLATKNIGEVELPKLSREAQCRPMPIKVGNEFKSEKAPEVRETYVSTHRPKFCRCVKGEGSVIRHEASEGIAVEMIFMSWVGGPVGIRIMRSDDFYQTPWSSYAMKFANERHHVRHVLNNVTTNDLVKFVVGKRIWNRSQIVNDIRVGPWI